MSKVIGVTGGIASGKSTISDMIKNLGFTVVDADLAARVVVEPGQSAYNEVVDAFGNDILNEDGAINRAKLGTIIFNNEEKRMKLNAIVHPAIRTYMNVQKEEAFERGEKVVFMDVPLLFESKLTKTVDVSLLVYVDDEVQLKRLMERNNFTEEEAIARIRSQMPLSEKRALADEIIDNNGSIGDSRRQLMLILDKWNVL